MTVYIFIKKLHISAIFDPFIVYVQLAHMWAAATQSL